jgi:hypothetical protein
VLVVVFNYLLFSSTLLYMLNLSMTPFNGGVNTNYLYDATIEICFKYLELASTLMYTNGVIEICI